MDVVPGPMGPSFGLENGSGCSEADLDIESYSFFKFEFLN